MDEWNYFRTHCMHIIHPKVTKKGNYNWKERINKIYNRLETDKTKSKGPFNQFSNERWLQLNHQGFHIFKWTTIPLSPVSTIGIGVKFQIKEECLPYQFLQPNKRWTTLLGITNESQHREDKTPKSCATTNVSWSPHFAYTCSIIQPE